MRRLVWENKSNGQLCITIPKKSGIKVGDIVAIKKDNPLTISYISIAGDLFHYGHLNSLDFAKSVSDYLICGVLSDKAVSDYRGAKPVANLTERNAVISSLNCVDRTMPQNELDPTENLKTIHKEFPKAEIILVHGSNWENIPGSEYIKSINGKIVQHPYYERLSNFKILAKIEESQKKYKDVIKLDTIIGDSSGDLTNRRIISTKGDTLKKLSPLLKKSKIEKIFLFTVSDWKNSKEQIITKIKNDFSGKKIVVRSSAINEDTLESSMAGYFESVLNVSSKETKETKNAIEKVINSYKSKKAESSFNQILVQSQAEEIVLSGVIFTRTLGVNAPYYVINYDDSTNKTDTVTSGVENKTIKISKYANQADLPNNFKTLLSSVKEIEQIIPKIGLDIEFAMNKNGEIIIFQVRPITTSLKFDELDEKVKNRIFELKNKFLTYSKAKPHLAGQENIYADMPDWNPAEIIGHNPNRLDYSLYDFLITGSEWHKARTSQGYYDVNPARLVVLFGNKPYVDVRNTFNSFVPASLSKNLREKLLSFYLDKLKKNPELQDKVEFEIVYSCYDFCFDERAKELFSNGFAKKEVEELKGSLISLTNNLVSNSDMEIRKDLDAIAELGKKRDSIQKPEVLTNDFVKKCLQMSRILLSDCKEKGTIQFSRLARLAFIGKIMLKSLVSKKILSQESYDEFMNSINTVATQLNDDFNLLCSAKMTKENFLEKYYHLRPGTYDITSPRYELNNEFLEISNTIKGGERSKVNFKLDNETEKEITKLLKESGLSFNASELFEFARKSLEAREFSKFEFSKNISESLELVALAGEEMGFTRQEMAMLEIGEIFSVNASDREEMTKTWKKIIYERIIEREINNKIELPPIISEKKDFDIIRYYTPRPNFITRKKVIGKVIKLSRETEPDSIKNKIVVIENADPGYDWIFTKNPLGLITKYGGVASHMSIRCAEFGIPAAIGVGIIYEKLNDNQEIVLDCSSQKII